MQPIPIHNPHLLKDRVILVTGASKGLGRMLAKGFAANGATVVLLARSIAELESLYDELLHANYPKPALYPFDLCTAEPKAYEELASALQTHFGKLDGLVHNAGDFGSLTPIEHYPIQQWYQILQLNLNSAFLLSQATLPLLKKAHDASIIFTTQNIQQQAKAYWGAYAASKFGLEALMQVLSDELEVNTQIRVNSIDPGTMRTAFRARAYPAENPNSHPLPSQLLPLYLYLMGPQSLGISGQHFDAASV